MKVYFVYMVTNHYNTALYIGVTNDLYRRINEHRSGKIPGFTAKYNCSKLVYYEDTGSISDAIQREKQLKKWSRAKKVWLIETMNSKWVDLYQSEDWET